MLRKLAPLLVVALTVLVLDQWTKYLAVRDYTTRFDGAVTLSERLALLYGDPPPVGYDGLHFRSKASLDVAERYLRLHYAENTGAAFGLFRTWPESVRQLLFSIVVLGAVAMGVGVYLKLTPGKRDERWLRWGLPLVVGGALGNWADRLARGFVIDFIQAHWQDRHYWPSFNVADVAVCVGVGMLLLDAFVRKEPAKSKSTTPREA